MKINPEDLLDAWNGRGAGEDIGEGGALGAGSGALAGAGHAALEMAPGSLREAGAIVRAGEHPSLLKYLAKKGLKGGLIGAGLGAGAGLIKHAMQPSRGERMKNALLDELES